MTSRLMAPTIEVWIVAIRYKVTHVPLAFATKLARPFGYIVTLTSDFNVYPCFVAIIHHRRVLLQCHIYIPLSKSFSNKKPR